MSSGDNAQAAFQGRIAEARAALEAGDETVLDYLVPGFATLRALLTVYVDNDTKWEAGKEALSAVEAQLETLRQERDKAQEAARSIVVKYADTKDALIAAEARVKTLTYTLNWYSDHKREDGSYDGELFGDLNAILALDGQEEHQ